MEEVIRKAFSLYYAGDYDNAFPLLKQGAEAGFIPAYVLLGDCYWNGDGVEADPETAIKYYRYAAQQGDADGLMRMGDVYLQCDELQKAVDSYFLAHEKGSSDALFNLGSIYYAGQGIEPDYAKAAAYFEKYTEEVPDDAEALHLLGRCYVFMKDKDFSRAEELFVRAAALGNQMAARDRDALQLGGQIVKY